jgi:L-iditol 2-dehydrogenase
MEDISGKAVKMKAIKLLRRGQIKYTDIPEIKIKEGWAKIKVMSCGLCGSDIQKILYDSKARNFLKTEILGHEISGIISDIQSNNKFKKGDRVAVIPIVYTSDKEITKSKSLGKDIQGGFAKYFIVPIKNLRKIPSNLSFELASLLDPLACALHAYHVANSPVNKKILIIGDGPLALSTLIICKKFSNKVTLTGKYQTNLKIASSLGAKVIENCFDFRKDSFDSIFECIGRDQDKSLEEAINAIKPKGKIIVLGVFQKEYRNKLILCNLFFKEGQLFGSNCYLPEEFNSAINILEEEKSKFGKIITHILPLKDFKLGLELIKNKKKSGAIKVIFKP